MLKFLKYPLAILLLSVYMITSTGFGVHRCSHEDSIEVLVIKSDKGCEEIHSHCGCESDGCSADKHDKNCCETEIHHLDLASRVSEESSKIFEKVVKLTFIPLNESKIESYIPNNILDYRNLLYESTAIQSKPSNSYLSQWRL